MKVIKQKVVRTINYPASYGATHELAELLDSGYVVIMCNKIGDKLEYIVQKEEEQE